MTPFKAQTRTFSELMSILLLINQKDAWLSSVIQTD